MSRGSRRPPSGPPAAAGGPSGPGRDRRGTLRSPAGRPDRRPAARVPPAGRRRARARPRPASGAATDRPAGSTRGTPPSGRSAPRPRAGGRRRGSSNSSPWSRARTRRPRATRRPREGRRGGADAGAPPRARPPRPVPFEAAGVRCGRGRRPAGGGSRARSGSGSAATRTSRLGPSGPRAGSHPRRSPPSAGIRGRRCSALRSVARPRRACVRPGWRSRSGRWRPSSSRRASSTSCRCRPGSARRSR